jgi:hypothetical protein
LAGKADDGRIITDAVLVLAQGDKHWFVTPMSWCTSTKNRAFAPALEQALSSALDNVRRTEKAKLCFTTGHREPTLEDVGPKD